MSLPKNVVLHQRMIMMIKKYWKKCQKELSQQKEQRSQKPLPSRKLKRNRKLLGRQNPLQNLKTQKKMTLIVRMFPSRVTISQFMSGVARILDII